MHKIKKDKRLIPKGYYCYTLLPKKPGELMPGQKRCPYWKYKSKYNAYCGYLCKDDKQIAANKVFTLVKPPYDFTIKEIPNCARSLLWDKCKECNIKIGRKYTSINLRKSVRRSK